MRNAIILLLVLAVAALTLAVSKPDEASFKRYIANVEHPDDASLIEEGQAALLDTQEKMTAKLEDHVLWVTVETTRGTTHKRYLGIVGMWLGLGTGPDR